MYLITQLFIYCRHCRLKSKTYVDWLKSADSQQATTFSSFPPAQIMLQTEVPTFLFVNRITQNHHLTIQFPTTTLIFYTQSWRFNSPINKKQQNISTCYTKKKQLKFTRNEIEIFPIEISAQDYLWCKSDFTKNKRIEKRFQMNKFSPRNSISSPFFTYSLAVKMCWVIWWRFKCNRSSLLGFWLI